MEKIKHVFKTDRKLFWLIVITLILYIAKNLVDIKTMKDFADSIMFCLLILAAIIALKLITKNKFSFEQGYLYRDDLFLGNTVKLENIRKIYLSNQNTVIEHQDNNKDCKLVIKNFLLETDILEARKFLKNIVDNANENIEVDGKILGFMEGNTESINDNDYSKFSGSLLILAITIIIFTCIDFVSFLPFLLLVFLKYDVLFALTGLLLLLNTSWRIVAIIMLFRKMKKAVTTIKLFRIYIIASACAISVFTYLMQTNIESVTTEIGVVRLVLESLIEVIITFAIYRFLTTSARVKNTLVE